MERGEGRRGKERGRRGVVRKEGVKVKEVKEEEEEQIEKEGK